MYLIMDHSKFWGIWGTQNGVEFRSNFEQGNYDACW